MQAQYPQRSCGFDNLKFLLIFCVVFGHILEGRMPWTGLSAALYRLIYSFHMPAFLFLSGWFARYDRRRIVFHLAYPYLLFQLLYRLFDHCLLDGQPLDSFEAQTTTPYWLLWYLFSMLIYHLLLPLIDVQGTRRQTIIVGLSFLLSILSSFDQTVGYYLSLGRLFTFLPFFVLGFYLSQQDHRLPRPGHRISAALTAGVALASLFLFCFCTIPMKVFYGVLPYEKSDSDPVEKLLLLAIACLWLFFFLLVLEPRIDRPIPVITMLGRHTLPIYLLHGFLVSYAKAKGLLLGLSLPLCLLITAGLLLLLGNNGTARLFRRLCTGWWLEKLWDKATKPGETA